jgi:hypothetical protein
MFLFTKMPMYLKYEVRLSIRKAHFFLHAVQRKGEMIHYTLFKKGLSSISTHPFLGKFIDTFVDGFMTNELFASHQSCLLLWA